MNKMLKLLGLGIPFFILTGHTLPVKYLAPACYRIDLSMSVVLFVALLLGQKNEKVWIVFAAKELMTLFFGNPGISFWMHLLLTGSNAVLDGILLLLFWQISSYRGRKLVLKGLGASFLYVLCAMILNGIYLARLYGAAYHVRFADLLDLAGRYNNKVQGAWSFLTRCVVPFYVVQTVLIVGLLLLFVRLLCLDQDGMIKIKDGTEHAACGER